MKTILVLHTGGTISMSKVAGGSVAPNEKNPLMEQEALFSGKVHLVVEDIFNIPSPHMTLERMFQLKERIQKAYSEPIDGVVITHGTDTLEETAYFLDLTVKTKKPVVVTGAMRSSSELGYDGPFNLATSICTAIAEESRGRGVIVCFNGELNDAREVTKANSMALNAFRTPNFGPVGIVDNNQVIFYRKGQKGGKVVPESMDKDVALIKCVAGMDSSYINFVIDNGYKGIVLEAMGRGNIPPTMVEGVKRAIKNNIPVVVVSRCFEGRVYESYGYEGGGKHLMDLGVIFGDTMPGQKARIQLLVAVNAGKNTDEIREMFEKGLYEHE